MLVIMFNKNNTFLKNNTFWKKNKAFLKKIFFYWQNNKFYEPTKHFLFSKMSSRRLEQVFRVTIFRLPSLFKKSFQNVFKTPSRRVCKKSSKDVFKASSQDVKDVFKTPSQDVFARYLRNTSSEDVFKTFSRLLQDAFQTCFQYVFETSSRRPLAIRPWRRLGRHKMLHWRRLQYVSTKTNVCWEYKTNTFFFNKIIPSLWKYNNFFLFAKVILCFFLEFKASLTLNDLCDTICMTHNSQSVFRFSFHCVYTFIQVVHTKFIKVVCTEYSAFKNFSKMS